MTLEEKTILWRKIKAELSHLSSAYDVLRYLQDHYVKKGLIDLIQQGKIVIWWHNARIKGLFNKQVEDGNKLVTLEDLKNAQFVEEILD